MEGHQIGVISERRRGLAPVRNRWPWITGGLTLQVIGIAMPVVYLLNKAHKEDLGGHLTRATIRLVWHQAVHSKTGLALMISGAVVFAAGSVLLARPFVKSWLTLLVAVPVAAIAGLLVLGAAVLIIALIVAAGEAIGDWGSGGGGGGGSSRGGSSAVADALSTYSPTDDRYEEFKRRRRPQSPQDPPAPS